MSVIGHGVDIVECRRIASLLEKHRARFCDRVLTAKERARAEGLREPVPHIAGRFAAKEAVLKMLGTGWRGRIAWTDIEITNDEHGGPLVELTGECGKVAAQRGIARVILSISHTQEYAIASAIGVT